MTNKVILFRGGAYFIMQNIKAPNFFDKIIKLLDAMNKIIFESYLPSCWSYFQQNWRPWVLFKNWAIPDLAFFIFIFSIHLIENRICRWLASNRWSLASVATQGTLRKGLYLSKCLVREIALVLLTSCDVMGLSMGSVNCAVTSG